jgi:hypothetical protein
MVRLERLVGVYDADGTIRGELAYLVGRRSRHRPLSASSSDILSLRGDTP